MLNNKNYSKEDFMLDNKSYKKEDFFFFWKGPLSQWYKSYFKWRFDSFNCMEQFMMFQKATFFEDYKTANKIIKSNNPKEQKYLGRQVKNFNKKEWDKIKVDIVLEGNYCKFSQNNYLKQKLLDTNNKIIVESSPFDNIWGIGLKANHPDSTNPDKWKGKNLLGFCLMDIRECLF